MSATFHHQAHLCDYTDQGHILGKIICNITDIKHTVLCSTRQNPTVREEIGKREGKDTPRYQEKSILPSELRKTTPTIINDSFEKNNLENIGSDRVFWSNFNKTHRSNYSHPIYILLEQRGKENFIFQNKLL